MTLDDYDIEQDGTIINKKTRHILKPFNHNKGYLKVMIGGKKYYVHRLVAIKYVPNPLNKKQVNHIDGNKKNNHYSNLEWCSNEENHLHAQKNNLLRKGENCSWSKLTEEEVRQIRENKDKNIKDLSLEFNVHPNTIKDVLNNRSWKHVT